jgi:two-component system response regulator TrcR
MNVLIVEDNIPFAHALRGSLEGCGYRCSVAHTLMDGFDLFAARSPEAVVSDLNLGDRSGLVLLEHVMTVSPRTTRILMSADLPHHAGIRDGLLHGMLSKPFSISHLCDLLGTLFAKTA